jgi:TATA-box binding protein (TBP) (component of TFIID and TFIIIB)
MPSRRSTSPATRIRTQLQSQKFQIHSVRRFVRLDCHLDLPNLHAKLGGRYNPSIYNVVEIKCPETSVTFFCHAEGDIVITNALCEQKTTRALELLLTRMDEAFSTPHTVLAPPCVVGLTAISKLGFGIDLNAMHLKLPKSTTCNKRNSPFLTWTLVPDKTELRRDTQNRVYCKYTTGITCTVTCEGQLVLSGAINTTQVDQANERLLELGKFRASA